MIRVTDPETGMWILSNEAGATREGLQSLLLRRRDQLAKAVPLTQVGTLVAPKKRNKKRNSQERNPLQKAA